MNKSIDEVSAHALEQMGHMSIEYSKLCNETETLQTNLRTHISTIVAAFFGIIASLHTKSDNTCLEWLFFVCVGFCVISLICLLISAYESLHNSKNAVKKLAETYNNVAHTLTPVQKRILITPKLKGYNYLFLIGCSCFCIAIILFSILQMPIWQ